MGHLKGLIHEIHRRSLWQVLASVLALQSCATAPPAVSSTPPSHVVNVNGFASGPGWRANDAASSFAVLPSPDANALFAEEVGEKVERLLLDMGYTLADPNTASHLVFVKFGIGPPEDPGPGSQLQILDLATFPRMTFSRYVPVPGGEYFRWLVVGVADAAAFRLNDPAPRVVPWLWIGETDSTGPSTDLRYMIDFLLIPTFERMGLNTGDRASLSIAADDSRVSRLKRPVWIEPADPLFRSAGPILFQALAAYPSGRPLELGEIRWASTDTSVLTVRQGGDAAALRSGTAIVGVTAEVVPTGRVHLAATEVTVNQIPSTANMVQGDGQTLESDEVAPVDPTVQILDAQGYPVAGVTIRFEIPSGSSGSADPREVVTNAEGLASTRWTVRGSGQQSLNAWWENSYFTFRATAQAGR